MGEIKHYLSGIVLGAGDTLLRKTDVFLPQWNLQSSRKERDIKQAIEQIKIKLKYVIKQKGPKFK